MQKAFFNQFFESIAQSNRRFFHYDFFSIHLLFCQIRFQKLWEEYVLQSFI